MNILLADGLHEAGIERLMHRGYHVENIHGKGEDLTRKIAGFDALIVRSATKVTKEVIDPADLLRVVGRAGVGVDNIDLAAARSKGIAVTNAPEGNTNAAAELTLALMLNVARSIPQGYSCLAGCSWSKKKYQGVELYSKTLGIIGYGRIGRRVADLVKGFDMKVIVYDPFVKENGFNNVGMEELLSASDFITVHTPGLGRPVIAGKEIRMMKPTAYLINASRGKNIDEGDVYDALKEGRIAGAAFDVYEKEGKEGQEFRNRLFGLPNFVGLPHLGASTEEAQRRTAIEIADNVIAYFDKGPEHINDLCR